MSASITRKTLLAGSRILVVGKAAGLLPSQVLAQPESQRRSDRLIRLLAGAIRHMIAGAGSARVL